MDVMKVIAELMAVSARTAPKAAGKDFVEIKVLEKEELGFLADKMLEYGAESKKKNFDRDGENVRNSAAVLLLSLKEPAVLGLDCGACGNDRCADLETREGPEFAGGLCAWRVLDLGIALGSAAKTASILNADNRIMYRIGVVARKYNLIDGELVVGIPISATGKSIFFDR
jgi:uncharacterized ferredoxin-like protein